MASTQMTATGLAVVTGAGSGIGRAAARTLAGAGRSIAVVDCHEDHAREVAALVRAEGGEAEAWIGDVADPDFAPRVIAEATARFGTLTDLVNSAAVRIPGTISDLSFEQWRASLAVGLDGIFLFCKAAIAPMAAAGGGSIVNISSPSAYGRKKLIAYSATKAAVNVLSSCLAADHLEAGIRVNLVIPPFTETGMTEGYPEHKMALVRAQAPGGRLATPDEIAALIAFLSSPAGASFTGGVFGSVPTPAF